MTDTNFNLPISTISMTAHKVALESLFDSFTSDQSKYCSLPPEAQEIVRRNFVYSDVDLSAEVLIAGMNPSYRKNAKPDDHNCFSYPDTKEDPYYFGKFHKLLKHYPNQKAITYLDILYQRHTEQSDLSYFLNNSVGVELLVKQLILTQSLLEQMSTLKLIMVFNRGAARFWGKNVRLNRKKNQQVWMGYQFGPTEIDDLYRITGLIDSSERINQALNDTNLIGKLIYFSRFLNYLTPAKDMAKIEHDLPSIFLQLPD
jgi:hypothetical protein